MRAYCVSCAVTVTAVAAAAPAPFPIEPGEAVATCLAGIDSPYVVGVIDIRDPGCDPAAVPGDNWPAPMYHNAMPNPTRRASDEWTDANLGPVFGVALDDLSPPNIYVTASSAYNEALVSVHEPSGRVFKLDGRTGAISVLATLPNTAPSWPGLGNIAYDRVHRQLYVTNHEDGKIYTLDLAGAVVDTFDPFAPDDGRPGFAPLGERLWGVGVYESRVYFGVWVEDRGRINPSAANTVWSVALDQSSGEFAGDVVLEVTVEPNDSGDHSNPVSDITFLGHRERMVLAERTMSADDAPGAHQARALEYRGGHLSWRRTTVEYGISPSFGGANLSAGGVAYSCAAPNACNDARRLWVTGDAWQLNPKAIYGLGGFHEDGGDITQGYLIDLDANFTLNDKTAIGDVEVHHPACAVEADAGSGLEFCGVPGDVLLDGSGTLVTGCSTAPIYRWVQNLVVVRDWSTDPTYLATPTGTTSYQLEVRCDDCPGSCFGRASVLIQVDPDQTPPDLGNTLLGVRDTVDVDLVWQPSLVASTYLIYRGTDKRTWPPAPQVSGLTAPMDSLPDVPGPADLYFYRVAGASCSGQEGP